MGSAVSTPHLSCVGFEAAHKAACLRNISSRRGPLHVGSVHTLHRDLLVNAGTLRPTEIGIWIWCTYMFAMGSDLFITHRGIIKQLHVIEYQDNSLEGCAKL